MSAFLPVFPFAVRFEDETARGNMRALKRCDMLRLLNAMQAASDSHASEPASAAQSLELVELGASLLPEYISDFSGITIGGNPAQLEDILEQHHFSALLDALLCALIRGRSPEEEPLDEKK